MGGVIPEKAGIQCCRIVTEVTFYGRRGLTSPLEEISIQPLPILSMAIAKIKSMLTPIGKTNAVEDYGSFYSSANNATEPCFAASNYEVNVTWELSGE